MEIVEPFVWKTMKMCYSIRKIVFLQILILLFMKIEQRAQSFLARVLLYANNILFVDQMKFSVEGLNFFKAKKEHSYMCQTETDILVNHTYNVIVRVVGVQLQAFDIQGEAFSKG